MAPLNWKLFNKVIRHIEADSRRLWMPYGALQEGNYAGTPPPNYPPCGTVACIGGWAKLLSTPRRQWKNLFSNGFATFNLRSEPAELLGLNPNEVQAIFFDAAYGPNRAQQRAEVYAAIRKVRDARIAAGEKSAAKIKL